MRESYFKKRFSGEGMEITEKELTRIIEAYLNIIPGLAFKKIRGSMGMRGILDLIICYQGRYYELEVKTERGKLSPEQKARMEAIRRAGGISEVVRSLEDVYRIFEGSKLGISINF